MERQAELIQLGWEAVAALQTPNWAEIAAVVVSGVVGVGQITAIGVGLWLMNKNGNRRDLQLDAMTKALDQQGEVLAEQLRASKAGR